MFTKDLKGQLTSTQMAVPASKANTAAATTTGFDTQQYEGDLLVVQDVGAVTGSITGAIEDSADNASFAAVSTPIAFTIVSSANNIQTVKVNKRLVRRYIRYVGTIVTGPALLAVSVHGQLKTQ